MIRAAHAPGSSKAVLAQLEQRPCETAGTGGTAVETAAKPCVRRYSTNGVTQAIDSYRGEPIAPRGQALAQERLQEHRPR